MNSRLVYGAFLTFLTFGAQAATYEWTSGWGMGVSEHLVDDGNGNELNISCPDYEEDGYVSAYATINGKQYSSSDEPGFDVIVDGKTYTNPFYTGCRKAIHKPHLLTAEPVVYSSAFGVQFHGSSAS